MNHFYFIGKYFRRRKSRATMQNDDYSEYISNLYEVRWTVHIGNSNGLQYRN